jgi:GNAT superfamily N-acetyltransferase
VSSDLELRPYTNADADGCVAVGRAAVPYTLQDVRVWRHRLAAAPARSGLAGWVALEERRIVGSAHAFLAWWAGRDDSGWLMVQVDPSAARRGIGRRLAQLVEGHLQELGARDVRAHTDETHLPFAERLGYQIASRKRISAVDPRTVCGEPALPVVPLADLEDRLEELYRLDLETTQDMPNEAEFTMPFEQWIKDVWEDPLLSRQGSFAVVVHGRVAGATNLRVCGARAGSGFTGVLREYRGRGIATAVKTASLRWAAEHGVEWAHTFNDDTNAAMLRVNERLGYRPWHVALDVERIL